MPPCAMIYINGGYMYYQSFDKIGQKMEEAKFMTPSLYKKNEFDKGYNFVAWWRNEKGYAIETDSDESIRFDFDN